MNTAALECGKKNPVKTRELFRSSTTRKSLGAVRILFVKTSHYNSQALQDLQVSLKLLDQREKQLQEENA